MRFTDRTDAGRQLARLLGGYEATDPVVVALPRGGVPVGAEVASALDTPLDLVLVRKIGVPRQPELAAGAVVDGADPVVVRNDDVIRLAGISEDEFRRLTAAELGEIQRRRGAYLHGREHVELADRTVIVVDDGIATGATMRAALQAIRRQRPRRLVLAVPVAAADAIASLRREVDDLICIERPASFEGVGGYYDDFAQVDDAEVTKALDRATTRAGRHGIGGT